MVSPYTAASVDTVRLRSHITAPKYKNMAAAKGGCRLNLSVIRLFLALNRADIFLCLKSGLHQFMSAALTFQAKVRSSTQNQPPFFPAWMGFFHDQNVSQTNIHSVSLSFDRMPVGLCRLLNLIGAVFIVSFSHQVIRQVLLANPMTWIIVGIQIPLFPFHCI